MRARRDVRVLVTGSAGFIGAHLVERLLANDYCVLGIDNLSDYYDVALKHSRLDRFANQEGYSHRYCNIENKSDLLQIFGEFRPSLVVHLAAQPGVRSSIINPDVYVSTNVVGTFNVLESCRAYPVEHLLMASSSSVYGSSPELPYREDQHASHPVSLYGATKKAAEVMAHSYAHLYRIPISTLRYFTVYGPWGRPDMAPVIFADALRQDRIIQLFNDGLNQRSFTYISDIIDAMLGLLHRPPPSNSSRESNRLLAGDSELGPYRILNVGGSESISTIEFIRLLEQAIGRQAKLAFLPSQPGDVPATAADCSSLEAITGTMPRTTIKAGVEEFVSCHTQTITCKNVPD